MLELSPRLGNPYLFRIREFSTNLMQRVGDFFRSEVGNAVVVLGRVGAILIMTTGILIGLGKCSDAIQNTNDSFSCYPAVVNYTDMPPYDLIPIDSDGKNIRVGGQSIRVKAHPMDPKIICFDDGKKYDKTHGLELMYFAQTDTLGVQKP